MVLGRVLVYHQMISTLLLSFRIVYLKKVRTFFIVYLNYNKSKSNFQIRVKERQMKTILITGGTSGIGNGLAMNYLGNGDRVIVVGSSSAKGEKFYEEARKLGAQDRAIYLKADLSLVIENQRIIKEIRSKFSSLDALILCAQYQKNRTTIIKTEEGFEFSFGLYYLSRYILSYGLKECLENSSTPVIVNVCAPGMKGEVNWGDLQSEKNYNSIKAIMHGSRLNDLLGVSFAANNIGTKIKYILFNPGAVQTSGAMEAYEQPVIKSIIKVIYKIIGKSVEKAILPINKLLEKPPVESLSAFKQRKEVNLNMETFDKDNAQKLYIVTKGLIKNL